MIGKLYEERTMRVFVARGGKRFFSREAARKRGAWDLIKQHCTCHWPDLPPDYVGEIEMVRCKNHQAFDYDEHGNLTSHRGVRLHGKIIARSKREERKKKENRKP